MDLEIIKLGQIISSNLKKVSSLTWSSFSQRAYLNPGLVLSGPAPDGCHPATVAVARRLNVVAEAIEGAGALPAGAPVMLGEWKARLCETTERAHLDMRKPSPRNYL